MRNHVPVMSSQGRAKCVSITTKSSGMLVKMQRKFQIKKGYTPSTRLLPLLSHSMSRYVHKYAGEWVTSTKKEKKKTTKKYMWRNKAEDRNPAGTVLIVQSFPCDLGSRNMTLRSWRVRYINCPVPPKNRKKKNKREKEFILPLL